jgi:D-alanyl-D-alanine carboxypeptidase
MDRSCHPPETSASSATAPLGVLPLPSGCRAPCGSGAKTTGTSRSAAHSRGRRLGVAATLAAFVLAGCSSSSSEPHPAVGSGTPENTPAEAPALAAEVDAIRLALKSGMAAHAFPGAVVVVRRGGQTRTVAVGLADVAHHQPMTPASRFRIASVTKSMTAATALELVAQGRLSLSDTVQKWEPGLLPRGSDITVADLLGQTSGLPSFQATAGFAHIGDSPPPSRLVALVARAPLMFEPGSRSWYSNTNYVVLGMILAKASHEPLAILLQHRLFDPFHLRSASLSATRANSPPLAHGYDGGKDVTTTAADLTWLGAAGGIVSSAEDVATFYDGLFTGKMLPAPLLHRMRTQRAETNHELPFRGYGLGIATLPTRCGVAYGHSGVAPGFLMHAWTTENGQRSVVVAVNTTLTTQVDDYVVPVIEEALCAP